MRISTDIVDNARAYGGFESKSEAEATVHAAVETLSERLSKGEAEDIAESLPEEFSETLLSPGPRHPQDHFVCSLPLLKSDWLTTVLTETAVRWVYCLYQRLERRF